MASNNDRGEDAIGLGERTSVPSPTSFPAARPLDQIQKSGLAPTANDPLPVDGNATPTENEYDTLAQVQVSDPNPYVNIIRQGQGVQKQQVQQAMVAAKDQDPEKTAKVLQLSDQLRLPVPIVERNYDKLAADKSLSTTDYDSIIQKTPGLAKFLTDPTNAALAKDDLDPLGKIDQANGLFTQVKEFGKDIGHALEQGTFQTASSIWALAPLASAYGLISPETASHLADNVASENKSEADLAAKAPLYLAEFQRLRAEHDDHGEAWKQLVQTYPDLQNGEILKALKDFGSGSLKTVGNTLSLVKDLATNPRASAYQLAEMTPFGFAMAPGAMAGGALGTLASPGIGTAVGAASGAFANSAPLLVGGKINDLLKAKGVDVTSADSLRSAYSNPEVMKDILGQAQRSGLTMAAVQALFMPLAGKFLAKAGPSMASQALGAGADIGVQSGGLAASDLAAQVAENKGDLSKVDPMQSLSNGILGLAHSVGSEVVGHSFRSELHPDIVEAAKQTAAKTDEAMNTVQNAQALTEMSQALKESKVQQRAPSKIAEMIEQAGHDNKVYFQPEDWDQYWKGKGISPVEAAQEVLGSSAPYFEAKQTGANLEIPMSDFASKLGSTEHFDNLIPETRSEPDGMKLSEANEHLENLPATMQELAKEAQAGTPAEQSAKAIKDEVKAQLVESGTLPADAEKQSSLYEAAFKSLGERTGQDPKALFDQYKLKIQRGETTPQAQEADKIFSQANPIENELQTRIPIPESVKRVQLKTDKSFEGLDSKEIRKIALKEAQANPKTFVDNTHSGETIGLSKEGLKKSANLATRPEQAIALQNVKSLMENGTLLRSEPDRGGDPKVSVDYYYTPFEHDGKSYLAKMAVKKGPRGNNLYAIHAQEIKGSSGALFATIAPERSTSRGRPDETILSKADLFAQVNEARQTTPLFQPGDYPSLPVEIGDDLFDVESADGGLSGRILGSDYERELSAKGSDSPDKKSLQKLAAKYSNVWSIDTVQVDPKEQGKGLAAQMLDSALREAKAQGADAVLLNASPMGSDGLDLDNLIDFYKSRGFKVIDRYEDQNATMLLDMEKAPNTLFQNGNDGPRGQIRIGADRSISIDLLKNKNLSTFLHETGHFYLEVLNDVANSDKATDQIKADLGTIREWLGAKEGEAFTTEQHEKFARGFETYLMEGKAPSSKLQKAFSAFKVWLANIYRQAKNLKADLTPEVRQVFDRLLASEDEIRSTELKQNMHPLFDDPSKYGMNEKQAARYIAARDEARNASEDELSNKLLDDVRKKSTAAYKEKIKAAREEATTEIDNQNIYKAINHLKGEEIRLDQPDMKLDRKAVVDLYGKEFIDKLPRGIFAKRGEEGMHPDMAAELLGFHSSDDMLTQMANTPKRGEAIEALAQQKIQERSPDLLQSDALDQAAMKAVHNTPREKLLRMELEHLAQNNLPVLKDVIRKVARRVPSEKQVRDQAEQIISSKKLEDAKPYLFERAEAKAAKEAGELLVKGDIDGAFEAKQKELLNHELWKAASDAHEDIEKSLDRFKKLARSDEDLSKTRDTDLVNSARSLLSKYGIGSFAEESPDSYLKKIKAYDEETYYTLQALMEPLSANAKPYDQLTYGEFSQLKETIDALWSLARSQKQITIDGLKISRDEAIAKLSSRLSEVSPPQQKAGYEKAKSNWDKTKMVLMGMKAALTRVEHWASALDQGRIDGPFQTHIFRPVEDGINEYRLQKEEAMKQVIEILEPMKEDLNRKKPIRSDELKYEFSGKSELLGALLHTGNDSNFDKLLRGNGWEKESWDAFIKRMHENGTLKKGDYDLVQNLWNFFELLKPEAQKAHKEMYGFHFNEITSKPFDTPFGRYEGGYAPALADPLKATDASIRAEKESLEKFNNSWMFPTTGRGFTKGRVETYAAPLQMDLRLVPGHVDKVLRFTNIEPRVKDVSKIVMNRDFRKVLDAFDPTVGGDLLTPWLQRAAQQKISTPTQGWAGRGSDIFFKELRNRTGLNSLVGNLGHIFHMFTGLDTAFVLTDPAKMRDALWTYVKSPKEMSQAMVEKSDFMKVRSAHQTSQLMETIEELITDPSKFDQIKAGANKYGYYVQQTLMNQIDQVTWHAAYNQAIEEGHNENLAVAQADSVVRRTQHASNPEDVSRFETGTPFVRFFTQFVSYFNMRANLLGYEGSRIYRDFGLKKGAGSFLYLYTLGHLIPALMHEGILRAMNGKFKKDDDESDLSTWMSFFFGSQARESASLVPIVGPVGTAIYNKTQGRGYDDRITTSPAMSSIQSAASVPYDLMKVMKEGTHGKDAIHDSLTLLGLITGLPLAPIGRPLGYLSDVSEGKAEPSGPIDFTRGLLTGHRGGK